MNVSAILRGEMQYDYPCCGDISASISLNRKLYNHAKI